MQPEHVTNLEGDGKNRELLRYGRDHGTAGSAANLDTAVTPDGTISLALASLSAARDPHEGVLRAIPGNRFVTMGPWKNPVYSPGQFDGVSLAPLRQDAFFFDPFIAATQGKAKMDDFALKNVLGSIVIPAPDGSLVRINLWEQPVIGQRPYAIAANGELLQQGRSTGLYLQNVFLADMNRLDNTGWIGYFGPERPAPGSIAVVELGSPLDFTDQALSFSGYSVPKVDYIDPLTHRPTAEALRRYGLEHATQVPGKFSVSFNGNTWNYEVSTDGGLSAYAIRDGTTTHVMYELRNGILVPETSLGRGSGVALNPLLGSSRVLLRSQVDLGSEYYGSGAVVFKREPDGSLRPYDRYSLGAAFVEGKNSGIIVGDVLELKSRSGETVRAQVTALSMKHHDGIDARGVDVYAVIGDKPPATIFAGSFGDLGCGIFTAARAALGTRS